MPGQPLKGQCSRLLTARAADLFEDEPGKDVLDYVCAWLEDGKTMLELARSLTAQVNPDAALDDDIYHFTPNIIRRVLLDLYTRDIIDARLRDSRTVGAHAMVDTATHIIDKVDAYTKEAVQHAKERANVRLWGAARYNRGELGDAPKGAVVNVQVNAGEAHITAMMRKRERPAIVASAEVLELGRGVTG